MQMKLTLLSPKKGPSRPFNFFGYTTTNAMDRLVEKIMPVQYNHTFLVRKGMDNILTGVLTVSLVFSLPYNHHDSWEINGRIYIWRFSKPF